MADEYITRASALAAIEHAAAWGHSFNALYDEVQEIPAADAVPVVRCRECKYCLEEAPEYMGYTPLVCTNANPEHKPVPTWKNAFCSYGEKEATDE